MRTFAFIPALAIAVSAISPAFAAREESARPIPPAPEQFAASFQVSDFQTKPWMREFEYVIVVNRATTGGDKQSIKIFRDQKLVTESDIRAKLLTISKDVCKQFANGRERKVCKEEVEKRNSGLAELSRKKWQDGVFKVTTGRDQFERKGEHHSQSDSWTTTPTGYFMPQSFGKSHKSGSYSKDICDSFGARLLGGIVGKEFCTYMDSAVFFNGPIAVHTAIPGTEGALGTKGSGGCIRLPSALAQYLFYSLRESNDRLVPKVRKDGSIEMLPNGDIVRLDKYGKAEGNVRGTINRAISALIIVENVVREAPFAQAAQ